MVKVLLIFTVWSNAPDGHQTILMERSMPEAVCLANQEAFWKRPFPTVGYDEYGPLPSHDAACVPVGL